VLSAAGFVGALAWLARAAHLTGGWYVAAAFLACVVVSTATGTSFGTILLCGPLLYPAGGGAGAAPAALMGAILAGATFGDSISPVSDTTIASSGTQQVDIGGTVRSRLVYAIPAGLVALIASALLGTGGAPANGTAWTGGDAEAHVSALVLLLSPALVIGMLLAQRHLIEALLTGIASATVLALLLGLVTPGDLLHIAPGTFGATGIIVDGMQRAVGVSVFTLLLVALVGTLQATDVMDRLVQSAQNRATSARAAESWIVGVVSAAVLLTTHSVVAILAVGEFARRTGERFGVPGYRRANLLDMTVCTWPFLLPYFLPTILASSASRSGVPYGMPALGAGTIGLYNSYAWALAVAIALAIVTGYGRERRPSAAA
jgi:Na+/H+ antiporter NhaC